MVNLNLKLMILFEDMLIMFRANPKNFGVFATMPL